MATIFAPPFIKLQALLIIFLFSTTLYNFIKLMKMALSFFDRFNIIDLPEVNITNFDTAGVYIYLHLMRRGGK